MSSLDDRRGSPRRAAEIHRSCVGCRFVILLYSVIPLIAFIAVGSFPGLLLTLAMLRFALRPLRFS